MLCTKGGKYCSFCGRFLLFRDSNHILGGGMAGNDRLEAMAGYMERSSDSRWLTTQAWRLGAGAGCETAHGKQQRPF